MNPELKKYCRLCAQIQNPLIAIFEGLKKKVLYNRKISDKIKLCLPISVAENDGLPQKICLACWKNLINCNNFTESSINADATLNQLKSQLNDEMPSKLCEDAKNNILEKSGSCDTRLLHATSDGCNEALISPTLNSTADKPKSRKRSRQTVEKESQSKDTPQVKKERIQQVSSEPERCGSLLGEPVPVTGNAAVAVIVADKSANSQVMLKIVLVPKDDSPVPVAERVASALQLEKRKKRRILLQGSKKSLNSKSAPELSFACFDCNVTFLSRAALVLHFRNIHPSQVMECGECGETVCGSREVVERHQALHVASKDEGSDLLSTMTSEVEVRVKSFEKTASAVPVISLGEYKPGLTKQLAQSQRQKILLRASSHPSIKPETKPQVMAALKRFLSKDQPYSVSQHLGVKPPSTKKDNCIICLQSCASKEELQKHLVRFHRPRVLASRCNHCKKVVAPYSVILHLNKFHAPGGHLLCSLCDKEYAKTGKPQPHMILNPKLPCKFPDCHEIFQSEHALNCHINSVHTVIAYTCEVCNKTFKTRMTLKNHIQWQHLSNGFRICEICGKTLKSQRGLENHVKYMHTKDEDCVCDVCGKLVAKPKMRTHMNHHIYRNKKRECNNCHTLLGLKSWHRHKNYKEKYGMDCSVRKDFSAFKKDKLLKYECKYCHKILSKPSWKYHQIFHEKHGAEVVPMAGARGFHVTTPGSNKKTMLHQCKFCHKYLGKKAWQYHQVFHEEMGADAIPTPGKRNIPNSDDPEVILKFKAAETAVKARTGNDKEKSWTKMVACEICNKEVRKYHLKVHMKLHSVNERKFHCHLCDKSFVSKRSMTSHMKEVHLKTDGYSCQYCKKYFKKRIALLAHEALHRNERNFHCPHCPKSFPGSGNLYGHIRLVHNPKRDIAPKRIRLKPHVEIKNYNVMPDIQYIVQENIEVDGCFVTPVIIDMNTDHFQDFS